MLRQLSPREWITSEVDRLLEIVNRDTLLEEEKLDLMFARATKIKANLSNPLFYTDLK